MLSIDAVDYLWTPSEGMDCVNCPIPTLKPITQPKYQLTVTNTYLYTDSATRHILLDKEQLVIAPNIIFLGYDRRNGAFQLIPKCVTMYIKDFRVFDRIGNLVFRGIDQAEYNNTQLWDGTIDGVKASPGVYVWMATVKTLDGASYQI